MVNLNTLKNFNLTGVTSANASEPMRVKKENPWRRDELIPFGFCSKGIYFHSLNREGFQFTRDETTEVDDGGNYIAPSEVVPLKVGEGYIVETFIDANGLLNVRGGSYGLGHVITWGAISRPINNDCNSIGLSKLNDIENGFLLSWIDDDQGDTLNVRVGQVLSDLTIGWGNSVIVDAIACDSTTGTSSTFVESGVGLVLFKRETGENCAVAIEYGTDLNIVSNGDVVEFERDALNVSCVRMRDGVVAIAYEDDDVENDPITINTLEIDDLIIDVGLKESIAGTAAAATSISCVDGGEDTLIVGWIDSTYPHVRCATLSGRAFTWGDELALASTTTSYLKLGKLGSTEFIASWENTGKSNYLYVNRFTRVGTTLTAGTSDVGVEAESTSIQPLVLDSNSVYLFFMDAANSNYLTSQYGQFKDYLIDVRSTTASITFNGYMLSKGKDSLGSFASGKITGTTHATADTVLASKPVIPFVRPVDVLILFSGKGLYVEDSGAVAPKKSGVDLSTRTIDVRSTSTSVAFTGYVLRVANFVRTVNVVQA